MKHRIRHTQLHTHIWTHKIRHEHLDTHRKTHAIIHAIYAEKIRQTNKIHNQKHIKSI